MRSPHISSLGHLLPPVASGDRAALRCVTVKGRSPVDRSKQPIRVELLGRQRVPASPRCLFQEKKQPARSATVLGVAQTAARALGTDLVAAAGAEAGGP